MLSFGHVPVTISDAGTKVYEAVKLNELHNVWLEQKVLIGLV